MKPETNKIYCGDNTRDVNRALRRDEFASFIALSVLMGIAPKNLAIVHGNEQEARAFYRILKRKLENFGEHGEAAE